MNVMDLRDTHQTWRPSKESQKYCKITPFYGYAVPYYLCLDVVLSVSPVIWQQFIDKVFADKLYNKKIQSYYGQCHDLLKKDDFKNLFKTLIKVS